MKLLATIALLLLATPAAISQLQTLTLNSGDSDIKMTLNTNHEVVHGTFHIQSGTIEFNAGNHKMSGSVIVAAGSGETGNSTRDKRMKKEVLKVEQYTAVSFEPKSYEGVIASQGDSTIHVTGVFTLLGEPHEMNIPLFIHLEGATATAKSHFTVPYVQWGLKDPSLFIWKADKVVDLELALVGQISR